MSVTVSPVDDVTRAILAVIEGPNLSAVARLAAATTGSVTAAPGTPLIPGTVYCMTNR